MSGQPAIQTIANIQKAEIDRLNDNRVFLMASMEEAEISHRAEIDRLAGIIANLRGMVSEDVIEEAQTISGG